MQISDRLNLNRTSRNVIASISLAIFALTGSFARADDGKSQTDTSQKQDATANTVDKNAKAVADSASKLDLSTPLSNVKFYGDAAVGYETTFGKTACKARQDGMFSQLRLGADIRLSKDVTLGLQVITGQYPNGFLFR